MPTKEEIEAIENLKQKKLARIKRKETLPTITNYPSKVVIIPKGQY